MPLLGQHRDAVQLRCCLLRPLRGVVEDRNTALGEVGGAAGLPQACLPESAAVERWDAELLQPPGRLLEILIC